jgi:pimeloyl-ACP methyl ester carboxylesterase
LLGGARSASFYRDTLDSLEMAIPGAQLRVLRGAGHMMHVDAHRQFNAILREGC